MSLTFHTPGAVDCWLRRIDARWKMAGVFVCVLAVACLMDARTAAVAAASTLLFAVIAGIGWRRLAGRLGPIVGVLLLFFGWSLLWPRGDADTVVFAGMSFSREAASRVSLIIGKTVGIVALIVALLETTPTPELGQGACGLGLPRMFVQLVLMTERYVFVLAEEFGRLRRAVRIRGFRGRADRRTFQTVGNIAGALLVRGHERADRVHHAMAARGFDGVFRSMHTPTTRWFDIVFLLAAIIAAAVMTAYDRFGNSA